jgi:hypothetical protein
VRRFTQSLLCAFRGGLASGGVYPRRVDRVPAGINPAARYISLEIALKHVACKLKTETGGRLPREFGEPIGKWRPQPDILRGRRMGELARLSTFGCTAYSGGKLRQLAQQSLHVPLDVMGHRREHPP